MSKVLRSSCAALGSFASLANPFLRNASAPALPGTAVVTVSAIASAPSLELSLADARVKVSPVPAASSAIREIPGEAELRIDYAGIDRRVQFLDLAGAFGGRLE